MISSQSTSTQIQALNGICHLKTAYESHDHLFADSDDLHDASDALIRLSTLQKLRQSGSHAAHESIRQIWAITYDDRYSEDKLDTLLMATRCALVCVERSVLTRDSKEVQDVLSIFGGYISIKFGLPEMPTQVMLLHCSPFLCTNISMSIPPFVV